jgi:hypothetical protein
VGLGIKKPVVKTQRVFLFQKKYIAFVKKRKFIDIGEYTHYRNNAKLLLVG